jgi:hypothetical protein
MLGDEAKTDEGDCDEGDPVTRMLTLTLISNLT